MSFCFLESEVTTVVRKVFERAGYEIKVPVKTVPYNSEQVKEVDKEQEEEEEEESLLDEIMRSLPASSDDNGSTEALIAPATSTTQRTNF